MTKVNRDLFADQNKDAPSADDSRHGCAPVQMSFEQSIESYNLALQSTALFSFEDLMRSGTWHIYEQRAASIARKHPSRDPFISYLAIDASDGWKTANSKQSYRSALTRIAARDIVQLSQIYWRQVIADEKNNDHRLHLIRCLNPHLDKEVIDYMNIANERLFADKLRILRNAVAFLLQVPPDPYHTSLRNRPAKVDREEEPSDSRASASKKATLLALNRHQRRKAKTFPNYDWRSHFWAMAVIPDKDLDDHRRACVAALMLTGCRPSEFCVDLGITVHASGIDDQSALRFKIAGAKVSGETDGHSGKGQIWRQVDMLCQTSEAVWLFDYISSMPNGFTQLQLPAATIKQTGEVLMPSERRRRVSVSLGKLITRLGKIAFPQLRHILTPYVFRHAFASDFKASGQDMDDCDLAAGLGHQSTRTQEHYGSANTARSLAGSRAQQVSQMKCSTPVRQPVRPAHPSLKHTQTRSKGHPGAPTAG